MQNNHIVQLTSSYKLWSCVCCKWRLLEGIVTVSIWRFCCWRLKCNKINLNVIFNCWGVAGRDSDLENTCLSFCNLSRWDHTLNPAPKINLHREQTQGSTLPLEKINMCHTNTVNLKQGNLSAVASLALVVFWDLHSRRVEAHVVDSAAGRMNPAVAQSVLQSLVGDVEADDQVELIQVVQGLGLRQSAGKTWTEQRDNL